MSIPKFLMSGTVAGLACFGAVAGAGSSSAGASSTGEAKSVLDEMCQERGGLVVWSPYSIARCQGARANKGFENERVVCEGLADGEFIVSINARHKNRASWGCFATSPAT